MTSTWNKLFPPPPNSTEADIPHGSLKGKVFMVTGGNSGVGYELSKILYSRGGTIYIAGRSLPKISTAISQIKTEVDTEMKDTSTVTPSKDQLGNLKSLPIPLDLSDLSTIAPYATSFLANETRLDILFNNAGISRQPSGSVTAQNHEIHMGTNCLGPFLLTKLLLPLIIQTAQLPSTLPNSVRVIFTASGIIDMTGPPGGVNLSELSTNKEDFSKDINWNYSASKAGNWFLAHELSRRLSLEHRDARGRVISIAQDPGLVLTPGWDNTPWLMRKIMSAIGMFNEPKMGAYSGLWAGFSEEVGTTIAKEYDGTPGLTPRLVIPWGRWNHPGDMKKGHLESLRSKEEGGSGVAKEFWDWCERETKPFC